MSNRSLISFKRTNVGIDVDAGTVCHFRLKPLPISFNRLLKIKQGRILLKFVEVIKMGTLALVEDLNEETAFQQ